MKKLMNLFLATMMVFSITFIGNSLSSNGGLSINAQTYSVNPQKRKKQPNGIIHRSYRGGKYVVRKSWTRTKWVSRKVWVATKWTGKKSWNITKKVASRTKKIAY